MVIVLQGLISFSEGGSGISRKTYNLKKESEMVTFGSSRYARDCVRSNDGGRVVVVYRMTHGRYWVSLKKGLHIREEKIQEKMKMT